MRIDLPLISLGSALTMFAHSSFLSLHHVASHPLSTLVSPVFFSPILGTDSDLFGNRIDQPLPATRTLVQLFRCLGQKGEITEDGGSGKEPLGFRFIKFNCAARFAHPIVRSFFSRRLPS